MKSQLLGFGSILVILIIGTVILTFITRSGQVDQSVVTGEGNLITFENYNILLIKTFEKSIEFISQRAAYELGENGGGYGMWSATYPTIDDLRQQLENKIKENLPQGTTQDDRTITWGGASINVSGYDDAAVCGTIENSKCFMVDGNKSFSIYDPSIDSRTTLNPYNFSQNISSNYFRLLNAGIAIMEDPTFNTKLNKVEDLSTALYAAKNAGDSRFSGMDFDITPILTTPVDAAFHLMGDVNRDGIIEGRDLALIARAIDTVPGDPFWNPDADLNGDDWVNYTDLNTAASNFGKFFPQVNIFEMTITEKCYPPSTYCLAPLKPGETGELSGVPYDYLRLKFRFQGGSGGTPLNFDFYIKIDSNSNSVDQGNSIQQDVSAILLGLPPNQVDLSYSITPNAPSITISFTPSSGAPSYSSVMNIQTAPNTPAQVYTIKVIGTGGGLTREATFTLTVKASDFTVAVNPTSDTAIQGVAFSRTVTITVTNTGGTPQPVSLSYSILTPIPGVTISSPSPATCTPSAPSYTCTSTFTVSGTATSIGTYQIIVTGTSGTSSASATYTLTVNPAFTFSVAVNPPSNTTNQDTPFSQTVTITVTNTGGTTQPVSLSASGSIPGITISSLSPPSCTPNPATCTSTFTVSGTPSSSNIYPIIVTGTSAGSPSATATYTLTVNPPFTFSVAVNPPTGTATQGTPFSQTVTITVTRTGGTPQTVSLSNAGSITGGTVSSPSPATCTPSAPSYQCTSSFTISTTAGTPASTYIITTTGTSAGSPSATATYTLTVNIPPPPPPFTFSVAVSPPSDTVTQGVAFSRTVTITVTRTGGTPQSVSLSTSGSILGVTISSPSPLSCTPSAPSYTCTSTFTVSGTPTSSNTYPITVTGTSGTSSASATYTLTVNPAFTFSVAVSPTSNISYQGSSFSQIVTITVTNTGGTSQPVSLSASGSIPGITITSPPSCTPSPITCISTFTVSGTPTSSSIYTITITGTSGTSSASATYTLTVNPPVIRPSSYSVDSYSPFIPPGASVSNPTWAYDNSPQDTTTLAYIAAANRQEWAYANYTFYGVAPSNLLFYRWDAYSPGPPNGIDSLSLFNFNTNSFVQIDGSGSSGSVESYLITANFISSGKLIARFEADSTLCTVVGPSSCNNPISLYDVYIA
jgi:hypothetical protein